LALTILNVFTQLTDSDELGECIDFDVKRD
jgi:hypothetical protein